nr:TonB-dependent receptor [uncultured Desulfobulbus sp.]
MNPSKVSVSGGLFCALGLIPFVVPGVHAADAQVVAQETMVVTAGRVLEKKENVTTNITVFTEEDIDNLGVNDVGDILRKEGFVVREYPNSQTSVGMRGFNSDSMGRELNSYILILVDGRPAGSVNLEQMSTDSVERIEVIRGPGSVQYGTRAMGGVINVITKKGKKGVHGSLETTLGSWEYDKQRIQVSGASEMFDASLSASRSNQDDYDTGSGARYYNSGYDSKDNINFNLGFTPVENHRLGLVYSHNDHNGVGSPNYLSANDLDDYVENKQDNYDFTYDGQDSEGFLQWKARYYRVNDDYQNYDPTVYGGAPSYFKEVDKQGAQAQMTAKWDFLQLTGGVEWNDHEITNSYSFNNRPSTYENKAGFLLAKTFLFDDKLIFSAGSRYDDFTVEGDQGESVSDENISVSIGAVYKIIPGLSVRANYAEAFKMPTPDELFMYDDYSAWGYGIYAGNEDLEPESSETYELGVDYSQGSFTAGLTWFHTNFENKISTVYNALTNVTKYENIEGATFEGFEGSLQVDVGEIFDWNFELVPYVNFTAMTKYEDDSTGMDLKYVPDYNVSWGFRFAHEAWGFSSRLNCVYYGEQNIDDYEGTGARTLGKNTVVDLSFIKKLYTFDQYGELSLKGEIANIFDEDYALVQGYPSPGRSFYASLNYSF